jgi:ATP-dependent Lon protease
MGEEKNNSRYNHKLKTMYLMKIKVEDLTSTLQVCLDSGAKKVLLPITSAGDLGTVPFDLVGAFSLIFYSSLNK